MFDNVGKDRLHISCVKLDSDEIETFRNRVESLNASLAMEFTVDGIVMLSKVLHLLNASLVITRMPLLRTAFFNDVHPVNVQSRMDVYEVES